MAVVQVPGAQPAELFGELLSAACSGDQDALGELWSTYQGRVHGYVASLAPAAAEDICSEVWLAVARGLRRFRGGEAEFRAWLFTIAHRRVVDHRRASARRPTVSLEAGMEPCDEGDPESEFLRAGSAEDVRRLVGSLPPEQATAILLRVLAGLSASEAAEVMGKKPGAVRVLTHRGLQRLATRLSPARSQGHQEKPVTALGKPAMARS